MSLSRRKEKSSLRALKDTFFVGCIFFLFFLFFVGIILTGHQSVYGFWPEKKKQSAPQAPVDSPVNAPQEKPDESQRIAQEYQELKDSYDKLQKDFQAISMDRDNLIAQAKLLLQDRGKVKELEDALAKAQSDKELAAKAQEDALNRIKELEDKNAEFENTQGRLYNEKKQLEEVLAKERDKSGIKKLQDDKLALQKENSELKATFKQAQSQVQQLKAAQAKAERESEKAQAEQVQLRQKIDELNKNYAQAVKKNKLIEQRVDEPPNKFVELAHQNKILIKQTGNMHYNLGVFYTKNKEYSRAIAEFEEAVKLRPDDAYSHFNLGYIYAEYIVNRPKAIEHFRHYLRLAKKDDKDLDWVKKYILTWQAWQGSEPME